jgi:hypothetical protein
VLFANEPCTNSNGHETKKNRYSSCHVSNLQPDMSYSLLIVNNLYLVLTRSLRYDCSSDFSSIKNFRDENVTFIR